jgi:hypothetical protein
VSYRVVTDWAGVRNGRISQLKCRRDYMTLGTPSFGVAPEPVRVLRRADGMADGWYEVRFLRDAGTAAGGKRPSVCMHVDNIGSEVPS